MRTPEVIALVERLFRAGHFSKCSGHVRAPVTFSEAWRELLLLLLFHRQGDGGSGLGELAKLSWSVSGGTSPLPHVRGQSW